MILENVDGTAWIMRDDKKRYVGLILRHADGEFVSVRGGIVISRTRDLIEAQKSFGD